MKKVMFLLIIIGICFVTIFLKNNHIYETNVEEIEYSDFLEQFNTNEEFILITSKEKCPYCKELYNDLNSLKNNSDLSIYFLDVNKLSSVEREWIEQKFENSNIVPHSYKIKNGIIIDDYIGYNGLKHFKEWLFLEEKIL